MSDRCFREQRFEIVEKDKDHLQIIEDGEKHI